MRRTVTKIMRLVARVHAVTVPRKEAHLGVADRAHARRGLTLNGVADRLPRFRTLRLLNFLHTPDTITDCVVPAEGLHDSEYCGKDREGRVCYQTY